ncbi:hypothetical protein GC207_00060 [bacterium]|nr:hypothetical protein [bacterium]
MMYFCILFVSPLYFVLRRKWGAFFVNATLYGLAVIFLISIVGAVIAPLFWTLAVGHASWHLRKELAHEQAELLATKMAQKMAGAQTLQSGHRDE